MSIQYITPYCSKSLLLLLRSVLCGALCACEIPAEFSTEHGNSSLKLQKSEMLDRATQHQHSDQVVDKSRLAVELVVQTQSRGKGVPDSANETFNAIAEILFLVGLNPHQSRWGIEGERRLCVTVPATQSPSLTERVNQLTRNIPMIQIYENSDTDINAHCVSARTSEPP